MTCENIHCHQGRNCTCTGINQRNSDGSDPDMPIVMFNKPERWILKSLRDAVALAALAGLLGIVAGMIFGGLK